MGLVYSQDWTGASPNMMPVTNNEVNTTLWATGWPLGWTGFTADPAYPEIGVVVDIKHTAGTGPSGEGVVQSNTGDNLNSGLVLFDMGGLTSPCGTHGWWNQQEGRWRIDVNLNAEFASTCWYNLVCAHAWHVTGDYMSVLAINRTSANNFNFNLNWFTWDGGFFSEIDLYDTGAFGTPSFTGAQGWKTIECRWVCGTVTGDNTAISNIAADGNIEVRWGAQGAAWEAMTVLFDVDNVDIYLNDGYDSLEDPSTGVAPDAGVQTANWVRGMWFGFYGMSEWTNFELYGYDEEVQKITQLVLEVLCDEDREANIPEDGGGGTGSEAPIIAGPCVGGGTVASGTNPSAGTSLATATQPLAWIELTTGGTTYRWAKLPINDATRKSPRVLSFGRLTRALTDSLGGFESASITVELSDYDRQLRGLMATGVLMNQPVDIYVADIATLASPERVFRGKVRDFRPEGELRFTLTIEDALTLTTSAFGGDRELPPVLIDSASGISDLNARENVVGKPVPLAYGALSDEDDEDAVGTLELTYTASTTFADQGAHLNEQLGNNHVFLVCLGGVRQIQNIYIADLSTGDPPTTRSKVPASAIGEWLWVPTMDGWMFDEEYYVSNGKRFTIVVGKDGHPAVELAREGTIKMTVNLCGYETVGDSTGNTITSPPRVLLHILNNMVFNTAPGTTDWSTIAAITGGGYSVFDTTTFDTVHDRCATLGYHAAGYVGHSQAAITLRDLIAQFVMSFGFDIGVNRHGQIMAAMLDRGDTWSNAEVFVDGLDILRNSLVIDPRTDEFENKVQYVYSRNYVTPLPRSTPEQGARLPVDPTGGQWLSGIQSVTDATSVSEIGETRTSAMLELEWIRDATQALVAAQERLALRASPRAEVTFVVRMNRGVLLELGQIIKLTHFMGVGSEGWTERRLQIRRLAFDLDRFTVTVTARDVEDLLPDEVGVGSDSI